jgi:hypothetical protein
VVYLCRVTASEQLRGCLREGHAAPWALTYTFGFSFLLQKAPFAAWKWLLSLELHSTPPLWNMKTRAPKTCGMMIIAVSCSHEGQRVHQLNETWFWYTVVSTLAISTHVCWIINSFLKFISTNEIFLNIHYYPSQYFLIWKK